ncbi:MAG: 23S rRNA (adenine(2503)-C(2))-methyltransferase RlmN [Fimbriimonadaceae bacterium]|nr:23S rRNA (adenine(2503)-C(2))-methyltransferase RlmN [Fimbriimonadaceae bacterium]
MGAPSLVGRTTGELTELVVELGARAYRGRQLSQAIYRDAVADVRSVSVLPAALRKALAEGWRTNPLHAAGRKDAADGVVKLLTHGGDGNVFECVLLPFERRVSCCISSQVGCPMACTFCATGLGGFERNLSVGEIVGQVLLLQATAARRISHVVFMGMGEPLLNTENVLRAVEILADEVGMSRRHVTISTVGIVPQIRSLAERKLPIHLALSLHAPDDDTRARLMPVNRRWPVAETVSAVREYQAKTGRKVTFEILLIQGVTDQPDQARTVAKLVRKLPCVVNLIPFNFVDTEQGFARPTRDAIAAYRTILESEGVNVTQRQERGHEIAAACGQLAGEHRARFGRHRTSQLGMVT